MTAEHVMRRDVILTKAPKNGDEDEAV